MTPAPNRSGLYVKPDGTRYFLDVDCEERWIASMVEQFEQRDDAEEENERLYQLSLESMGALDVEDPDPPQHERPRGLMMDVEDERS